MSDASHENILLRGIPEWNSWRSSNPHIIPDLEGAVFEGLDLTRGDFRGARAVNAKFIKCSMFAVNFLNANLASSVFSKVTCYHSVFIEANLYRANCLESDFLGSTFARADLSGAQFGKARLARADFSDAILREASFDSAMLRGAKFYGADLEWANLRHANFKGCRLDKASLENCAIEGTQFSGAKMISSNLRGLDFRESNIDGVDLRMADLGKAILSQGQLAAAITDPESSYNDRKSGVVINLGQKNIDGIYISTLEALIREVEKHGSGCIIKITGISEGKATVQILDQGDRSIDEIERELNHVKQQYALACKRIDDDKVEISELKRKNDELLLRIVRGGDDTQSLNATIVFIDIAGFSELSDSDKGNLLEFMWSVGKSLLNSADIHVSNTWGDGLMAAFKDPNNALIFSDKFVRVMREMGKIARVGVNWGRVSIIYNSVRGSFDLVGRSVDAAARLEPMVKLIDDDASILSSAEVMLLHEIRRERFSFKPVNLIAPKPFASYKVGDVVECYIVRATSNL